MTNAFSNMDPDEWPDLTMEEQLDILDIVATAREMTTDDQGPLE